MQHAYAVILAGGEGTRFQPYSTAEKPKQFLPITHPENSMLQETYARIAGLFPTGHILISTNQRYSSIIHQQLEYLSAYQIIGEPLKRNTLPAAAMINHYIHRINPNAVVFFLPADHFIAKRKLFWRDLRAAYQLAISSNRLITFGIPPTFPSSDYGYIQRARRLGISNAYAVQRFVEKPDISTAKAYQHTPIVSLVLT